MMLKDIVQYPFDAQSDSFFCALSSALLPALGYTENTPYFCAPKGQFAVRVAIGRRCKSTIYPYIMHCSRPVALLSVLIIRKTMAWRSTAFQARGTVGAGRMRLWTF